MKYLILLLFSLNLSAQSLSIEYSVKQAKEDIDKLKSNFENRVYERIIPTSVVETIPKYHPNAQLLPFDTNHFLFYRFFDFDDVEIDSLGNVYTIGKVFVSERYSEEKYQIKFKDSLDYFNDKDGFFYYCKLYYSQYHKKIGLNIYLNMIPNICEKGMHLNSVVCLSGNKMDSKNHDTQHGNSVKILIKYSDYSYSDFIPSNSLSSVDKKSQKIKEIQLLTNSLLNTNIDSNKIKKSYFIREKVNLAKRMKIFEIDPLKKAISLKYTKPSDNEDFISNGTYSLTLKREFEKNYPAIYRSSNPEIYNLIFSAEPDDQFIMGKSMGFSRVLMTNQIQQMMDSVAGANFSEKLQNKIRELNALKPLVNNKKIGDLEASLKKLQNEVQNTKIRLEELESYRDLKLEKIKVKSSYYARLFNNLVEKVKSDSLDNHNFEIEEFYQNMIAEINYYKKYDFPEKLESFTEKVKSLKESINENDTLNISNAIRSLNMIMLYKDWQKKMEDSIKTFSSISKNLNTFQDSTDKYEKAIKIERMKRADVENGISQVSIEIKNYTYISNLFLEANNDSLYIYIGNESKYSKNFQNQILLNPFYLRRGLPNSSNINIGQELFNVKNAQFAKGTIAKIYDPFSGELGLLRRTVKSRMPGIVKTGWRKYYYQNMGDLLFHQKIDSNTFDSQHSKIEIIKFEGKSYFWIHLSKPLADNIEILPFFVSKKFNFKNGNFKRNAIKDYKLGGKGLL